MAGRIGAVTLASLLVLLILSTTGAVAWRADRWGIGPSDWSAVRFTVLQAALSAGLSCLLAVPVARALARRQFPGRRALIALMGAPFLLPVVVAVLGILAVFGRNGVLNQGLDLLGLPQVNPYGLQGVVLAHVFLNLPLVVRMVLAGWQAIPVERFRLAESLGMRPMALSRHLEGPMLRDTLPGAFLLVLLLCLSSFAVALTLGGGPRATTVELAIYQALRFDFDLGRAAGLAVVQIALCILAVLVAAWVTLPSGFGAGLDRAGAVPAPAGWRQGGDALWIMLSGLFLLAPLIAVAVRGLPGLSGLPESVWAAAGRSVAVAVVSAGLAVSGAMLLAQSRARWIGMAAMLPMAVSGLVLGTGLFLLLHPVLRPETLAIPVTILVNATLSLPLVYRLILPEARRLHADYGRLQATLGLQGWAAFRLVTLPRLRRVLGFATGVAVALSMGDLGVNALFAGEQGATLPLMVQRLMASYRMEAAAGAALLLVAISFALFALCDRWGRHAAA